jgi:DNA-binding NarL/FixJ family response regulator
MLLFLRSSLSSNFNICDAVNGKDALDKINLIPKPDLILSDVMMDEMDGYELLEHIREIDGFKHIPFVFLTAKTDEENRKKGLQYGAVDYIGKPFDIEELKIKLQAIINLCRLQQSESQAEVEERILNVIRNKQPDGGVQYLNFDRACAKYGISDREKEVLKLIFLGKENKEIAYTLDISYSTVATHFQNIMKKCDVQNKIDLHNLFRPQNIKDSGTR